MRDALPDAVQALKWPFTLSATVRPNGEALEANAVLPDRYLPLTVDNYARYSDVLVETAVEAGSATSLPPCGSAVRRKIGCNASRKTAATKSARRPS